MSDSVDRVFVHALATVRRLPRTGSSRPPPSARLRLYGLYKQSMEGNVESILSRPTLPPPSPTTTTGNNNSNNNSNNNNNSVHRYASRDLRTREAQAEIEKWDAWHACADMSRTEAKRRYISTLIDTMKEYASGTPESRELVSELEFVWSQIRSQSGSDESESGQDGDSPTRRLERAGLKPTMSYDSTDAPPALNNPDPNRLRVLSPVSQRGSDDIMEAIDADSPNAEIRPSSQKRLSSTSVLGTTSSRLAQLEAQLRQLTLEITALRESLSSAHLLSSSTFQGVSFQSLPLHRRIMIRISSWSRWLIWSAIRYIITNSVLVLVLVLWGRWRGDPRVEEWVKRRWKDMGQLVSMIKSEGWDLSKDVHLPGWIPSLR